MARKKESIGTEWKQVATGRCFIDIQIRGDEPLFVNESASDETASKIHPGGEQTFVEQNGSSPVFLKTQENPDRPGAVRPWTIIVDTST